MPTDAPLLEQTDLQAAALASVRHSDPVRLRRLAPLLPPTEQAAVTALLQHDQKTRLVKQTITKTKTKTSADLT